jgi:uncharacterized protein YjbI with pentapeptide repeats
VQPQRADLSGANLYSVNLSGANLYSANLSDAHLSGADLSFANLRSANLSGANLSRAILQAVVWNTNTKWLNASGLHQAVNVSPELMQDPAFSAAIALSDGIRLVEEGKVKEAQNAFKQAVSYDPSLKTLPNIG